MPQAALNKIKCAGKRDLNRGRRNFAKLQAIMSGSNSVRRLPIRSRNANLRFFRRCSCNWSKVTFSTRAAIASSRSRCSCCNVMIRASISVFSKDLHSFAAAFEHRPWVHGPGQKLYPNYTRSFDGVHEPFGQVRRHSSLGGKSRQNDLAWRGRVLT